MLSTFLIRQTVASGEVTHLIIREDTARRWSCRGRSGRRCRTRRRRTSRRRRYVTGYSRGVDARRRSGGWRGTGRRGRRSIPVIVLWHVGMVLPRWRHVRISIRRVAVLSRWNTNWRRDRWRWRRSWGRNTSRRGGGSGSARSRSHGVGGIVGTARGSRGGVWPAFIKEASVWRNIGIACTKLKSKLSFTDSQLAWLWGVGGVLTLSLLIALP